MGKSASRALVIDACIAQSAGETEDPVSKACRAFLIATRDICHRVVMTNDVVAEWKKHRSKFSWIWWRSMVARRKVVIRAVKRDVGFGQSIVNAVPRERSRTAPM